MSYGKCHLCDVTCFQCSGPEQEACTSCPDTRLFDDGRCSIRCQTGRYAQGRQCERCHHSCHECVDEGPNNCTSCDRDRFGEARYFFQGQCRDVCPEGFFHSARSRCEPCAADCVICTAENQCVHCSPGHKPRNGQCVPLECSEGEVAEDEECLHCDEGCKRCEREDSGEQGRATACLKCEDGYYQLDTDCHQTCPDRTYSLNTTMVCSPCQDRKCVVCDQSQCYWCEDGFYTFGGECVDRCMEGFFVDEESRECESCHRSCRTCGGPRYDDCDSCEDGFALDKGECVEGTTQSCSEGHFRNSKKDCEQCHSTCKTCSAAGKEDCRSCHSGKSLTAQQTCVSHCPSGTFANAASNQCEDCSEGCVTCQDTRQCRRCRSGLYLQNGQCVTQCQRGFDQDGNCQPCAPECASCRESAAHCLSCQERYFLLDHSCKSSCPGGYFTTDGECRSCPAHCSECNEDGLCKKCAEYYFLHEGTCVDDCPKGYFASEKQQECVRCHTECATCDGPGSDDCLACRHAKAVRYNGECLAECPGYTYYDGRTNECRDCDRSCLTCSGPDPSSCLSCDTSRRKDASGHCTRVTQCPPQSYTDHDGNCQQCHKLCNLCSGPGKNNCLTCNKPHFLLNGTCAEQCPAGYFAEDEHGERACERCHFSCDSCAGRHSLQCVACKTGFFKQGSSCVESCSESHFGDTETMVCERCDPSCSHCSGPGNRNCLSCRQDYFYVRQWGQCVQSCPLNFYLDQQSKTCHRCHSTCKTCTDKGALSCLSCYESFTFHGGICMSECLLGFYGTSTSDSQSEEPVCRPCDSSCMDCRGPGARDCTVCHAVQILSDDGRCLSCCGDQNRHEDKTIPWECCDCEASIDECVMGVNFVLEKAEAESSATRLFVTVCVLLVVLVGVGLFLFLNARSKSLTLSAVAKAKAGGYKKLDTNGGGVPAQFATSSLGEYSDRILDCKDNEEEEDDIVYMGKDGVVYRKFKYGLLDEDDVELEYDDESYSYI